MKRINQYVALFASSLMLASGLAGCAVFKPSKSQEGSGKGLQGWVVEGADKAGAAVDKAADAVAGAAGKVAEAAGLKATPEADAVLSGDWAILEVLGKKAVGETPPCLKFEPGENRMYGNNGCNVINADYTANYAEGTLSFGNIASTMRMCGQTGITDVEVGQALGMTAKYSVKTADTDATLLLFDAQGKQVMKLMQRDFHFLDGTWAVEEIDGEKVHVEGMKLALDVDGKRLHGNTGCNIINGLLETDMETANSISFSKIGMTRMACPDSGWETRLVMALEEAVTADPLPGADRVALIGSNGSKVMILKKTSPIED